MICGIEYVGKQQKAMDAGGGQEKYQHHICL